MPEYRKFTKDVGIVGIAEILMKVRGIILIPVIAKTLGASEYGIYATLMATISLLAPISTLGLLGSMVRFLAGEKNKKEIQEGYYSVLSLVFLCSFFISVLLFLFAPTLASTVFGDPQAAPVIKIGTFLILIQALQGVNLHFFLTFRRIFRYSLFQVIQTFGEVILAAILVLKGFGLDAVICSFLTVDLLFFLITFALIFNEINIKPPSLSRIKLFLSFGLPLIPGIISQWVTNLSDRYVIGFFLSSASIGIYSAAYGIGLTVQMFLAPISTALTPTLPKLWEENKIHELKNHFRYSLKYFLMLAIPSLFGLSVLAEPLLIILSRPEFVPEGRIIIPLVALAAIMYGMYSINAQIFLLLKKTTYITYIWLSGAILNLVINIILIPEIGIIAAAISTLLSFFMMAFIASYHVYKNLKLTPDWIFILKSLIASSLMAFIVFKIRIMTFPEIFLPILLGAGIYFVALILLRGFTKKEYEFLKGMLRL